MDWCYLGHAMWLAQVDGIRILFDPLLGDTHHDGVFGIQPHRTVHAEALRPDLVVVTHRHPDHFDPSSLHRLANLDPATIVLTADAVVGRTCQDLGFAHVSLLPDRQVLPLDGATLITTPSHCDVIEWGMIVASRDGVVWNEVDSDIGTEDQVAATLAHAAQTLGRPAVPDLGIVRWQPLQEVQAQLADRTGFPAYGYGIELDRVAWSRARTIIPGASGERHLPAFGWLNHFAYPVTEARFLRDVARRCPGVRALPGRVGTHYRVAGGEVHHDETVDTALVDVHPDPDPRRFEPLAVPPVHDPNRNGHATDHIIGLTDLWVREAVAPALASRHGDRDLAFCLRVVLPDGSRTSWTVRTGGGAATVDRREEADYDVLNIIAGSELIDVLEARSHWGRPLLAGLLRSSRRAYEVDETGLRALHIAPFFLYYALSYDRATERWAASEVSRLTGRSSPGIRS